MSGFVAGSFDVNRPVVVFHGGPSREREISLKSGQAVAEALIAEGLQVRTADPVEQPVDRFDFLPDEVAFIALHGEYGEDGGIQRDLAARDIPFTGCGAKHARLAANKWEMKRFVEREARLCYVSCSDLLIRNSDSRFEGVEFPVVVKPALQGSSIGLSLIERADEFAQAVEVARAAATDPEELVLVEPYVAGVEYTVSVLAGYAFAPVRIECCSPLFDFHAKYESGESRFVVVDDPDDPVGRALRSAALEITSAVGMRGLNRVDFIWSQGQANFLEVNTIPGMTERSLAPLAAASEGVSLGQLCLAVLADAIS